MPGRCRLPPLTEPQKVLAEKNYRLVRWQAYRHSNLLDMPWLYEEMFDLGTSALIKAARAFDPARGKFSTLFVACFRGELRSRAMANGRAMRRTPAIVWLDSLENNPDEPTADSDPADEADGDRFARMVARIRPMYRKVLELRLREGWTYERIGRSMGVSKQRAAILERDAVASVALAQENRECPARPAGGRKATPNRRGRPVPGHAPSET